MNYQSLWTVDRLRHPDRARSLTAFIAAHRPMPFERLAFSLEPDTCFAFQPSPRVRYVQWVMTRAGDLDRRARAGRRDRRRHARRSCRRSWPSPRWRRWRRTRCLLLTAMLAAGFARFTLGVWPAIVTAARARRCGRSLPAARSLRGDVGAALPQHELLNLPGRRLRQLRDRRERRAAP